MVNDLYILERQIQEAAYGEYNELQEICCRPESVEHALEIMNPNNLRRIAVNACNNLTELGMEYIAMVFAESGMHYKTEFAPTDSLKEGFRETLLEGVDVINREIYYYEKNYNLVLQKIDSSDVHMKSLGGAFAGAFAGAFVGPIGALVGSIVGGGMAEKKAINQNKDFLVDLGEHFCRVGEQLNKFLEGMAETMHENLIAYAENLYGRRLRG